MMNYLFINGYKTINTEEFYKWYTGKIEYYGKTLMITFDDGNYEDYYLAYPIIKKYNFKAISFLVGSKINKTTKKYNKINKGLIGLDIINKLRKEYPNFEFQSHSYNMHSLINGTGKLFSMSYQEIEEDFLLNRKYNFSSMSYPYGYYNKQIREVLYKNNYSVAFGFWPYMCSSRESDRFLIPRIKINSTAGLNTLIKWLK